MLPDTTLRRLNALSDISKQGKRINGLTRIMMDTVIWKQAYNNIASNNGAITKGINDNTLDGFSIERAESLIEMIKSGEYKAQPVRRTHIPKQNGKMRPLGIPTGDDKLVQEVTKIILTQIYEGTFSEYSHGFRAGKSCHTALKQVKETWTGTKWMIVMDIKGFFDNIDHDILIKILEKKIDDKRFIKLIKGMLKAGYMENWKFNKSYSGTPQGGIISPILANIYLNELDLFMEELRINFNKGEKRKRNPEMRNFESKMRNKQLLIERTKARIDSISELELELENAIITRDESKKILGSKSKEWRSAYYKVINLTKKIEKISLEANPNVVQSMKDEYKELAKAKGKIPHGDTHDPNYRRLNYNRYADDFIIGIIGSKQEAKEIAKTVTQFINDELGLAIAENKFNIVQAKEGISFLGFVVQAYDRPVTKGVVVNGIKRQMRSNGRIQLIIPNSKLNDFSLKNGYGDIYNFKPKSRGYLVNLSDAEIISTYNAELRGLVNYYSIGNSAKAKLNQIVGLARQSCAITLAHKHRTTTSKIISSMQRSNGDWVRKVYGEKEVYEFKIYRLKTDFTIVTPIDFSVDNTPNTYQFKLARTELIQRLEANVCEACGSTEKIEVHHVKKLKDLKGKNLFERQMIAKRRKTLVLCSACHDKLHVGKLN